MGGAAPPPRGLPRGSTCGADPGSTPPPQLLAAGGTPLLTTQANRKRFQEHYALQEAVVVRGTEELVQRQKVDECQHSLVLKTESALPTQGITAHVQDLLCQQLNIAVTVLKVQPLGNKQHSDSDSQNRKHAYKVGPNPLCNLSYLTWGSAAVGSARRCSASRLRPCGAPHCPLTLSSRQTSWPAKRLQDER